MLPQRLYSLINCDLLFILVCLVVANFVNAIINVEKQLFLFISMNDDFAIILCVVEQTKKIINYNFNVEFYYWKNYSISDRKKS